MASLGDTIIRVVLFVFSAISLALTSAWIHNDKSSSRVRFSVFAAAFSLLFGVFYGLLAAFIEIIAIPFVLAITDALNIIFLFAAGTCLAAKTHAASCSKESNVKKFGFKTSKNCSMGEAASAFLYFSFACAIGNFVYSLIATLGSSSLGTPGRKSAIPRTGIPTASQV